MSALACMHKACGTVHEQAMAFIRSEMQLDELDEHAMCFLRATLACADRATSPSATKKVDKKKEMQLR